jgi:DNA (cytosine-5)-methyltransferase 1
VLENPKPFIVRCAHGDNGRWGKGSHGLDEPLPTVAASNDFALVAPCVVRYNSEKSEGDTRSQAVDEPISTVDTQSRFGLIASTLIQTGYGERDGQSPRVPGVDKPLGTVVSGGAKHAVVSAFLAKHFGGMVGVPLDTPTPTITSIPTQNQIVAANLIHLNHGDKQWSTVDEPARTVTSGKHAALVYSFLVRYFGTAIGQHLTEPLYTITGKDRFGLVTVTIDGELYVIADIGMRMLTPRELARAQGFPDSYVLTGTKTSQVARIGNSVPPVMAKVLVEANLCGSLVNA